MAQDLDTLLSEDAVVKLTTAQAADLLYRLKQARLEADKVAKDLKDRENKLKAYLIAELPQSDAKGVVGQLARATIKSKNVPVVEDWDAFYKHIQATGQFELMQRRVSDSAVKERWDNDETVPGVGYIITKDISLNKV